MPLPEFDHALDRVSNALRISRDEVLCHAILADESVRPRVCVLVLTIRKPMPFERRARGEPDGADFDIVRELVGGEERDDRVGALVGQLEHLSPTLSTT
jgi:hypothetical protein